MHAEKYINLLIAIQLSTMYVCVFRFDIIRNELKDTKVVIRIRKSKKNRQCNGQKNKQRSTKHAHKTKDRVTRTPLKTGCEFRKGEQFLLQ